MYIYEGHLGSLYTSYDELDFEDLHCEQCGDWDYLLGYATNRKEAYELLKNAPYEEEYIKEFVEESWAE